MRKRIVFIINPISGTRHSDNIETIVNKELDAAVFDVAFRYTERQGHGGELAEEAFLDGVDIVAAVGGDGTINEVASRLVGTGTALAVIPHGSGNGLAYHLHIPINLRKSIRLINSLNITEIDTCMVNGRHFFSIAGIGFDAKVAYDFSKDVRRGFQNYLKYIIKNYFTYKTSEYHIQTSDTETDTEAFFITFANSSQWGYNIKIAPKASVQDGKLDLCICHKPLFLKMLNIDLPFLLSDHFDKSSLVRYMECCEAVITAKDGKPIYLHMDGDAAGLADSVTLKVLPRSLKTIIPLFV